MRRVAITGIGVISALGRNRHEFWDSLRAGRSGIAPIEQLDTTRLRFHNGAEVRAYDAKDFFPNGSSEH